MSPEQAAGEPVTSSSDLFSLGCVLYLLCCCQLPFQGKTILSVLNALASQTPASPVESRPDLPAGLNSLVMRLLAKSPEQRPESAQQVVDTIRTLERQLAAQRQDADIAMGTTANAISVRSVKGKTIEELPPAPGAILQLAAEGRHRRVVYLVSAIITVALGAAVWFARAPRWHRGFRPDFPTATRPPVNREGSARCH